MLTLQTPFVKNNTKVKCFIVINYSLSHKRNNNKHPEAAEQCECRARAIAK